MVKKLFITFIFLTVSNITIGKDKLAPKMKADKKVKAKRLMSKKWYKLNSIIHKEIKTIKSIGQLGPKLTYRLMELYTEKLKLLQEKENKLFLNAFSGTGEIKEKKEYFKKSRKLYDYTHKIGKHLVLAYPNFIHKSDIFYTMALNSREYGDGIWIENYLLRALKNAPKSSKNIYNIKTNLAEHYYNNKKYEKAIYFYKDILRTAGNEWHSKHLYNASWSYLKLKMHGKAISHLLEAYKYSQNKKYLSVEDQVLNSVGLFYVYAGKVKPGVNFYIKNVKKPAEYLITMSKKAADKLGQEKSDFVLKKALTNSKINKQLDEELLVRTAMLENYRTFKLFNKFYKTSLSIYKLNTTQKIPKEFITSSVEKIKSLVGYLQVRLSNNMKKNNTNYDKRLLSQVINFFKILSGLDPQNTDEYRFFQGETYFSVAQYKLAAKRYILSLKYSISKLNKDKNKKTSTPKKNSHQKMPSLDLAALTNLQKKIFNSLFATIAEGNLGKKLSDKYTIFAYENHLSLWPINEKSQLIYPKLFNIYLKKNKVKNSLRILMSYSTHYKVDVKKQRAMLGSILDIHIKNENTDKLAHWISKMEKGFLSFEKEYIAKATGILSSILFKQLQIIEDNGKNKEAKLGYLALYKNPKYPKKIKAKSSFKLSVLLLAKGYRKSSLKWYKRSIKLQEDKEFKKNLNTIFAIQESYYKQQDFKRSILVSNSVIKRLCNEKFTEKDELMRNIVHFSLLENNYKELLKNYDQVYNCTRDNSFKEEIAINIITHLKKHRLYDQYFSFSQRVDTNERIDKLLKLNLSQIYWDEIENFDSKYRDIVRNKLENIIGNNAKKELKKIKQFEEWRKLSESVVFSFSKQEKFDEEKFNADLQNNLNILKVITDSAAPVIKDGLPQIMLPTYKIIVKSFEKIAKSISDYTPSGVPPEFVKGFKDQMKGLESNLLNQSREYHGSALKIIQKEKLLTNKNSLFTNSNDLFLKYNFRYPSSSYTATMDQITREVK